MRRNHESFTNSGDSSSGSSGMTEMGLVLLRGGHRLWTGLASSVQRGATAATATARNDNNNDEDDELTQNYVLMSGRPQRGGPAATILQEVLGSGLFRHVLMALVVVAVMIHLALIDKSSISGFWRGASSSGAATSTTTDSTSSMDRNSVVINGEERPNPKPSYYSPHTFTFGGDNNQGRHPKTTNEYSNTPEKGNEKTIAEIILEEEIEEEANEFKGMWDLDIVNKMNDQGHYLHDPFFSPFASRLYDAQQDELDRRQAEFNLRMQSISKQYGAWTNPDKVYAQLPSSFLDLFEFLDVPMDEFPEDSWQKDQQYIFDFLDKAKSLVENTMQAIMLEYGYSDPSEEDKEFFDVIVGDYEVLNGTAMHHLSLEKLKGIAYLSQRGWNALVRKLLHAMITHDHFYVVVAGGAETYAGNNFAQSQIMQFNYIMEPLMHKLGMTLISRNMGMDASTAVSALGGADIYGEMDILWHIQDIATEDKPGEFDLLQRQAILSGDRIPIIFSPDTDELTLSSKEKAWVGNLQPGHDFCRADVPDVDACQSFNTYNSVCWEHRSDWNPATTHDEQVGSLDPFIDQHKYPGNRQHRLEGRKMALLLLHAINGALDRWKEKFNVESMPLAPQYWHVQKTYTDIRKAVMELDRTPGEAAGFSASCELLLRDLDPRICHVTMHAFTEWTPRVIPRKQSLSDNACCAVLKPQADEVYDGPDIVPLAWRLPENEIDVHMIAIAANITFFVDPNGRKLREADSKPRLAAKHSLRHFDGRKLGEFEDMVDRSGWVLDNAPAGFCDGSAQSRCNRVASNVCLLANHNFYRGALVGTPHDGWLTLKIPNVRHGIILARFELDINAAPDDFVFEFSINGKETSISKSQLGSFAKTIVSDLTVYPLLLEKGGLIGRDPAVQYDVAIRFRSDADRYFPIRLSHIYYA